MAMRQRAWLAWRSPPRLRRWRVVCPLEAWMGLAPQRAAKDASLWRRWGVVAGGDEECGGCVGSDAVGGEQGGVGGSAQGAEFAVEGGDLSAERLVAPGEAAQRTFGRREQRVGGGGRSQAGAGVDEGAAAVAAEVVFERLGDRDEEAVDLVVCLCAGLDRGAARDGEHADRLDGAVVGFGHGGGVAGEGGARARLRRRRCRICRRGGGFGGWGGSPPPPRRRPRRGGAPSRRRSCRCLRRRHGARDPRWPTRWPARRSRRRSPRTALSPTAPRWHQQRRRHGHHGACRPRRRSRCASRT